MKEASIEEPAERQGCALDEEAWAQLLRLQEPCERRCPAQADPRIRGYRRQRVRQPGVRRSSEQGQHVERGLRRQRLPLGRDGAQAEGARLQKPYPQARTAQTSAERRGGRGELQEEQGAGAHRARVRRTGERAGRAPCPSSASSARRSRSGCTISPTISAGLLSW